MKLQEIAWPVYKLGNIRPQEENNVLFYFINNKLEVLDDKSLPAKHLAGRRLQLSINKEVKLYKLKLALFFLGDLVKLSRPNLWFIDSNGQIFQYKKSKFVKLHFRKITNVIPSVACSLIEVEGISTRFKCLYPPKIEEKYAGLLKVNGSYILYGFYDQRYKDTVRKI